MVIQDRSASLDLVAVGPRSSAAAFNPARGLSISARSLGNGVALPALGVDAWPSGFGLRLLGAGLSHLVATLGLKAFDAGAGLLRNWRPSAPMGPRALELGAALGPLLRKYKF